MHDILDLQSYPLNEPSSPAFAALVKNCKAELENNGMFNLPGFMRQPVAEKQATDLQGRFETEGFLHERRHNIYFSENVPGVSSDHPVLTRFNTSNRTLCADQLRGSALEKLYEWEPFRHFLAEVMERPELYVMADPLARVNAMSYSNGQALNWHFDRSEFTTTLLLQSPEDGGIFEYRPGLRTITSANHDGVANLIKGRDRKTRTVELEPGTLNVFKGKNTAHRVTPSLGHHARIIAVFSYYERAGVEFSPEERTGFYGRAEPVC
ncbi:MAG: 2OG-Fe(II) oxygenase [Pseudomonadota bacterium]